MNKYDILDIIDEGAYGIVWKAVNKQNNRIVAIKQFKEGDEDEISKKNIQRQIRMLKMLKGDYVVQIMQAFKKKGKIYLIFQFFEKNILNVIQRYDKGLKPKLIQKIIYMSLKCLRFLHQKNVIHRDVKPENILINNQYTRLKFCDFGFARFYSQNHDQTEYVATRWYRSPQLLVGEPYSKPVDIWALGCILGELIDGQPMFPGENEIDQLFLITKTVGSLTQRQVSYMKSNPKFVSVNFPPIRKHESIQSKYLGKIQKNALDFLRMCLKLDPSERITAEEGLNHPYLIELSLTDNSTMNDQEDLLSPRMNKHYLKNEQQVLLKEQDQYNKQNYPLRIGGVGSLPSQEITLQSNDRKKINNIKKSSDNLYNDHNRTKKLFLEKNQQVTRYGKGLAKIVSEQKKINMNLDVNVRINLKIDKINSTHQLPQITHSKSIHTIFNKRDHSEKNLINILGETKEIIKVFKKSEY